MFVAERFMSRLSKIHGKHNISTDGGTWYPPQACKFLKIDHHLHSAYEKSIIERTMQYIKDRTEGFDDYFPCRRTNCKLKHVKNWLNLFVDFHNKESLFFTINSATCFVVHLVAFFQFLFNLINHLLRQFWWSATFSSIFQSFKAFFIISFQPI